MVSKVNLSSLALPESLAAQVEERIKLETQHVDNFRKVDTFLMCILETMRQMDTDIHRSVGCSGHSRRVVCLRSTVA